MPKPSHPANINASHRPYFRAAPGWKLPPKRAPKRSKAAKRRGPRQRYDVPLPLIAELLGCHAATPYAGSKRFGLAVWIKAKLRGQLTRGAGYAAELQYERTIRFNAGLLERHARFVLGMRGYHPAVVSSGEALARLLGVPVVGEGFHTVWVWHLQQLADELVEGSRDGHLEDLPTCKAEAYIDHVVIPRVRLLERVDRRADVVPNLFGGLKRLRRLHEGLTSQDPEVVRQTLLAWDGARVKFSDVPDQLGWEDWPDGAEDHDEARETA